MSRWATLGDSNDMTDEPQDRNPFVLVLVDGDGYLVGEEFFLSHGRWLTHSSSKNTLSKPAARVESVRLRR